MTRQYRYSDKYDPSILKTKTVNIDADESVYMAIKKVVQNKKLIGLTPIFYTSDVAGEKAVFSMVDQETVDKVYRQTSKEAGDDSRARLESVKEVKALKTVVTAEDLKDIHEKLDAIIEKLA